MSPIAQLTGTYRHLGRYQQILRVLFTYGLGEFVDALDLTRHLDAVLAVISRRSRNDVGTLSRPERLRMALEALGPTFIKLAQILSTRPDLIPIDYAIELSKLQDRVSPFPFEEARALIEKDLGKPLTALFLSVEPTPLAAASIAQVHRATLLDGREVIIKIRRPGIKKIIEADLEILGHLATIAEENIRKLRIHAPGRIVKEFARSIERELDFTLEAANTRSFARRFDKHRHIHIPEVHRELCTESILVLEYVHGIKPSGPQPLIDAGLDPKILAKRGATAMMHQIFDFGMFHADPHPGNLFMLPGNRICFLDFGQVGRISRRERADFIDLLIHAVRGDERRVVDILLRFVLTESEPDRTSLERDCSEIIEQYLSSPIGELQIARIVNQAVAILMGHGLGLRPHFYLMLKALATAEGVARSLDPTLEILRVAIPFVRRARMDAINPLRIAASAYDTAEGAAELMRDLPTELRALLKQAREGKVLLEFEHRGLGPLIDTLDRVSSRVSFAIVLASLVVGSSLVIVSHTPPFWKGIPLLGLAGFLAAGFIGFGLLISLIRKGRT